MAGSWKQRLIERLVADRVAAADAKRRQTVEFYDAKLETSRLQLQELSSRLERRAQESQRIAAELVVERRRRRQLEIALDTATRYDFGSLTPPVDDWVSRWREERPRVVLFAATRDYGGSLFSWARAINRRTDWAARLVVVQEHRFGYANDISYGAPLVIPDDLHRLLEQTDVIHLKDEAGFLDGTNGLPTDLLARHDKPIVFTQYGDLARARQDDAAYRHHVASHDAVVCITPDLCFRWLSDPRYIPHAVDTASTDVTWDDANSVGHSPSTIVVDGDAYSLARKGTADFEAAVAELREKLGLDVEMISGVSHQECLRRKSRLGVFFDQAGLSDPQLGPQRVVGWYGNAGLEAAVRGIPTIAHLPPFAFEGARRGGHEIEERCAIVGTGLGADAIADAIRSVFELPPEARAELSRSTRRWVEEFHDDALVGPQLAEVYESVRR